MAGFLRGFDTGQALWAAGATNAWAEAGVHARLGKTRSIALKRLRFAPRRSAPGWNETHRTSDCEVAGAGISFRKVIICQEGRHVQPVRAPAATRLRIADPIAAEGRPLHFYPA